MTLTYTEQDVIDAWHAHIDLVFGHVVENLHGMEVLTNAYFIVTERIDATLPDDRIRSHIDAAKPESPVIEVDAGHIATSPAIRLIALRARKAKISEHAVRGQMREGAQGMHNISPRR